MVHCRVAHRSGLLDGLQGFKGIEGILRSLSLGKGSSAMPSYNIVPHIQCRALQGVLPRSSRFAFKNDTLPNRGLLQLACLQHNPACGHLDLTAESCNARVSTRRCKSKLELELGFLLMI